MINDMRHVFDAQAKLVSYNSRLAKDLEEKERDNLQLKRDNSRLREARAELQCKNATLERSQSELRLRITTLDEYLAHIMNVNTKLTKRESALKSDLDDKALTIATLQKKNEEADEKLRQQEVELEQNKRALKDFFQAANKHQRCGTIAHTSRKRSQPSSASVRPPRKR